MEVEWQNGKMGEAQIQTVVKCYETRDSCFITGKVTFTK